jgi:flagellar motility protein MotE (MotC chaperone)
MFNFPDITGSVPAKKEEAPGAKPGPTAVRNESTAGQQVRTDIKTTTERPITVPDQRALSPAERAILERLQERRKELEARAKELDTREQLLRATEKRLEGRVNELKQMESRIKTVTDKKDEAESTRFKGLISMYENMKAKDAARIFDRLDLRILADVAGQINPRRMSDILANMSPEAAERLTVEFASRGGPPKAPDPADLPKIEGRPSPSP